MSAAKPTVGDLIDEGDVGDDDFHQWVVVESFNGELVLERVILHQRRVSTRSKAFRDEYRATGMTAAKSHPVRVLREAKAFGA